MDDAVGKLSPLITRRPFRRSTVDQETLQDIIKKISHHGVRFSIPFGGYKSRWIPNSPNINWAEVLWLDYLRQYAEPMTAWVDYDIEFAFTYMSGVLGFINGTTDNEQEGYLINLGRLMQKMSGEGIQFRLKDLAKHHGDPSQALSQVVANYESLRESSFELSKAKINAASRNCDQSVQATDAALRCEAMESLPARRAFNKFGEHIQLSHMRGSSLCVHIGSCRSSVVQPWAGIGVFEQRNQVFLPRILGRSGFNSKLVTEDQLDVCTLGLSSRAMNAVGAFPHLGLVPIIKDPPAPKHHDALT